jgi:uncharacterized SAM-binding protein YcdF (DUF218 family)
MRLTSAPPPPNHAQQLWDFLALKGELKPVDALLVLGSNDVRIAEYGARLYLAGYAPLLIFSGAFGRLTTGFFSRPEAEVFAEVARQQGVPADRILVEAHSTNTGENLRFTQTLIRQKGLALRSIMLLQKPYMARRALATAQKVWVEVAWSTAPALLDFTDYPNTIVSQSTMIAAMLGEYERLRDYPEKGFIAAQTPMPESVVQAYNALKAE